MAHPSSCSDHSWGRVAGGMALTTHSDLMPKLKKELSCTFTTLLGLPGRLRGQLHLYSLLVRKVQDNNFRNTSRTVLSIFSPYLYFIILLVHVVPLTKQLTLIVFNCNACNFYLHDCLIIFQQRIFP